MSSSWRMSGRTCACCPSRWRCMWAARSSACWVTLCCGSWASGWRTARYVLLACPTFQLQEAQTCRRGASQLHWHLGSQTAILVRRAVLRCASWASGWERWRCSLQGFTYWIRQPGREASPAPSEERPLTPSQSQGGTPSVSPMDSPSVSARSSADEEVDFSQLSRCAGREANQNASWEP